MTNFDDRYRLLKCVALGGGMRTHNAQENATGRPVMVHIVDAPDPDVVERLREQVHSLPSADRSRIVEMTETPNGFAVVSEFLAGLTTFPEWIAAHAPAPTPPHAAAAAAPAPAPAADPVPTAPEPAAPPEPSSRTTELMPAPAAPPELTQSFVIGRIESSRSAPAKGVQPPGEFTQLFKPVGREASVPRPPRQRDQWQPHRWPHRRLPQLPRWPPPRRRPHR